MAIDFIPYEELFAHEYQPTYIVGGIITMGPYTFDVYKTYTVTERQKAYQDCAKWLNWLVSDIQEEWELCMYMYQWIIKSPAPFPYEEYTLAEIPMADVPLTIIVPDAWIIKVLDAFNKIAGTHMTIEARGSNPEPSLDFDARWDFRIDAKGVSETNTEFGQRVLRELGKAVINMVDKAEDETRYRTEISAILPPVSDVPTDVLT